MSKALNRWAYSAVLRIMSYKNLICLMRMPAFKDSFYSISLFFVAIVRSFNVLLPPDCSILLATFEVFRVHVGELSIESVQL